jgi:hypothetical protein
MGYDNYLILELNKQGSGSWTGCINEIWIIR